MNIFVLDSNPKRAAMMQCDVHVVKMVLETSQLLCTYFNELGFKTPYKSTHKNHPCSVWLRESPSNVYWLLQHGCMLSTEYKKRYNKRHKSSDVIWECVQLFYKNQFDSFILHDLTPFKLAMPDKYYHDDPVVAYRQYYRSDKKESLKRFTYTNSEEPSWLKNDNYLVT